ncbi:MAG: hypothetical protein K0Q59_1719 [Paenibacillus sp.]|nr:hypothetical protein [Paenibacillus sp.]
MAEFILLRCSKVNVNGDIVVSAFSASSADAPVSINTPAADALRQLTGSGYALYGFSADSSGFSYTLTKGDDLPADIRELLLERIGETVALETSAGTVSGVVVQVGVDVVELRESTGDTLLVPLASVQTVF